MSKVRLTSEDGGLRILTLNDPDKRNIIDDEMREALIESVAAVRADPEATALVVTGAGTAFCGGADLPAIFGGGTGRSPLCARTCTRCTRASWCCAP